MITFGPLIACRYFSVELAKLLHAVAAWSDVAGVTVTIVEIREEIVHKAPAPAPYLAVMLQPASCLARDRRALARYLRDALRREYLIEARDRLIAVEWFPPGYTPH